MIKMRVEVGPQVARDITTSGFASETGSDLGLEIHAALVEPVERVRRGCVDMLVVEARVEAWEALARWIAQAITSGPVGVRRFERACRERMLGLATRINMEINRLANHPAYKGMIVLGISADVLPAWRLVGEKPHNFGTYEYPPAPTLSRAYAKGGYARGRMEGGRLEPVPDIARGRRYTRWEFIPDVPPEPSEQQRSQTLPAG